MTVIDTPGKYIRFTIFYVLLSVYYNTRILIKTKVQENLLAISISNIYFSANWAEREIWDMFGVPFFGHNDLRRIFTDYNFIGHPIRKDFPLSGFYELIYSEFLKNVIYTIVELTQEYRVFKFSNPWNLKKIFKFFKKKVKIHRTKYVPWKGDSWTRKIINKRVPDKYKTYTYPNLVQNKKPVSYNASISDWKSKDGGWIPLMGTFKKYYNVWSIRTI